MLKTAVRDSGWRNYLRRVPRGSILYLPGLDFDNWHTGTIKDYSGQGSDGTITGATFASRITKVLPSGLPYLDYDGTDDEIDVGSGGGLNDDSDKTQEAWVYPTHAAGNHGIVGNNNLLGSTNNLGYMMQIEADDWSIIIAEDDGTSVTVKEFNDTGYRNKWQHIVGVLDIGASSLKLYRNASNTASGTPTGFKPNTISVKIGEPHPDRDFLGGIALVRIYNRALSSAEITDHYQNERHFFGV